MFPKKKDGICFHLRLSNQSGRPCNVYIDFDSRSSVVYRLLGGQTWVIERNAATSSSGVLAFYPYVSHNYGCLSYTGNMKVTFVPFKSMGLTIAGSDEPLIYGPYGNGTHQECKIDDSFLAEAAALQNKSFGMKTHISAAGFFASKGQSFQEFMPARWFEEDREHSVEMKLSFRFEPDAS